MYYLRYAGHHGDLSVMLDLCKLTLKVLVTTIDALGHFEAGKLQHSARGWGGRVGEVRAGTTSPMPEHNDFKLQ